MFRRMCVALLWLGLTTGARAEASIPVVATFSILGDIVKNVGGERVAVETLIGPNGDAHDYAPKPTDVKKIAAAKIIVANGLGFERWLPRLVDGPIRNRVVTATNGVTTLNAAGGAPDPHAWQSVNNVRIYVGNIRDALITADPAARTTYETQAAAYVAQLDALESDIRQTLAGIAETKRRAVTPHPSFGYYGAAYGIAFTAPQQHGHEAEASAKTVAALIDLIKREKVSAIFGEGSVDSRLLKRIAAETGVKLGGALYSDALSEPSGPAPTYIAMMRQNLRTIESALRE